MPLTPIQRAEIQAQARAWGKIRGAKHIGIISHQRPDSDAFGSTYALGMGLRQLGKKVTLINPSPIPAKYLTLGGDQFVTPDQIKGKVDLLITVDCASQHELGPAPGKQKAWKIDINIDHHQGNRRYASINLVAPRYPANCAHLVDLFKEWHLPITKSMAAALYVGILGDTGHFRFPGVTAHTMATAAYLACRDIDISTLADIESKVPHGIVAAAQKFLALGETSQQGRLLVLQLTHAQYQSFTGDWLALKEYILDVMSHIEGVEVYAFLRWVSPTDLVGSLRSKPPHDVNAFAQGYSGGGHRQAAGLHIKKATSQKQQAILQGLQDLFSQN